MTKNSVILCIIIIITTCIMVCGCTEPLLTGSEPSNNQPKETTKDVIIKDKFEYVIQTAQHGYGAASTAFFIEDTNNTVYFMGCASEYYRNIRIDIIETYRNIQIGDKYRLTLDENNNLKNMELVGDP